MASTVVSTNALIPNPKLNNEVELYKKAARLYNKILRRTLDPTEFEYIEKLALSGETLARFLYGFCFAQGVNTQENAVKAFEYYQKSGHPWAQFHLGICYFEGRGVERNLTLAVKYLEAVASHPNSLGQSLSLAQHTLGLCYEQGGDGIARNLLLALTWYDRAASGNNSLAIKAIARLNNTKSIIESQLSENTKLKAQIDALNAEVAGLHEKNDAYQQYCQVLVESVSTEATADTEKKKRAAFMNILSSSQKLDKLLSSQLRNLQGSAGNSSSNSSSSSSSTSGTNSNSSSNPSNLSSSSSSSSSTCGTNSNSSSNLSRKRPHSDIDISPAAPTVATAATAAAAAAASTTSPPLASASASSAVADTSAAAANPLLRLTAARAAMSPVLHQNGASSAATFSSAPDSPITEHEADFGIPLSKRVRKNV